MFDKRSLEGGKFKGELPGKFDRIARMGTGTDPEYFFKVTCNNEEIMCKRGYLASMNDHERKMNFCERFFVDKQLK